MNLNELSPYIRYTARSYLRAPFKIGQRIIFDYELIYVDAGTFLLTVDGRDYVCNKGDVIFLRPGQPHCLQSIGDCALSQPHIHFDMSYDKFSESVYISFKDLPDFSEEEKTWIRKDIFAGMDIGPLVNIPDMDAFRDLLFDLISDYFCKPELYQLKLKQKMLLLLQMLLSGNVANYEPETAETNIAEMIKQFVDYNYKNAISLDSLSEQFHYSRYLISRAFAAYTGTPIIKYYNQKRLAYAKEMLFNGASVTEIANELSFSSIYTFSRFFKNAVGCSPSEYKNRAEND